MHKSGFVNIIGLPNVGKSTLMNALIGEKLSIITSKAQTTRHRLYGIYNDDDYQIVFSDTPGFINKAAYKLQKHMNDFVASTFEDADLFLFVTHKYAKDEDQKPLIEKLQQTKVPIIVVINKMDECKEQEVLELIVKYNQIFPTAKFVNVSALQQKNTADLFELIKSYIPEHPPYFDKDDVSDRNQRFFVTEIIREKILEQYEKEIPYSCEVVVEEYKEEPHITKIRALIYVERDSQKNIIIGKGGSSINKLGTEARKDIEEFIGTKVFLDLFVKVMDNWRNNEKVLKKFGYM
ncbi:MAG: GTPase Era [Bacteroidota bacterium]